MSRGRSFGKFVVGVILVGVGAAVAVSVEPRCLSLAQELVRNCLELYQANPSIGAVLIASAIGLPAGYLFALMWPRRGLFSTLSGKRHG